MDLSGYSRDEAIGKPATDILKCFGVSRSHFFFLRRKMMAEEEGIKRERVCVFVCCVCVCVCVLCVVCVCARVCGFGLEKSL